MSITSFSKRAVYHFPFQNSLTSFLSIFSASRLTLGHVNEFGVFCSGMEEQPPDKTNQDSSGI